MGAKFGSEKCEKMHIGKKLPNPNICTNFKVDIWKNKLIKDVIRNNYLVDIHMGKERMRSVNSKTYLGQIVQSDGKNELNN